jgi:hypothetical protein
LPTAPTASGRNAAAISVFDRPWAVRVTRRARPGGSRIRISGTMGFGRLKIRHARR